jgi:hypothetical protein
MIEPVRIVLSATWVCLALIYLLGDVLRIFAGDFKPGEISGVQITQGMMLGIAAMMVIPILMVFLTLVVGHPAIRWANIIVAVFFFIFNLFGLPTYPGVYDKFLLIISMAFNALTVWTAWNWM